MAWHGMIRTSFFDDEVSYPTPNQYGQVVAGSCSAPQMHPNLSLADSPTSSLCLPLQHSSIGCPSNGAPEDSTQNDEQMLHSPVSAAWPHTA